MNASRIVRGLIVSYSFAVSSFVWAAVDYEGQIQPLLEDKCYRCHSEEEVKGELRLDSPQFIMAGGEYGEVLVPGDPNESSLYILTTYPKDDPDYMPQKGKGLSGAEQGMLKKWIEEGALFGDGFVHAPKPKVKSKFEEADLVNERKYMIMGEALDIVNGLRESGLLVDTVNHDSSRFEISYTYAEREAGAFDFDALQPLAASIVKVSLARSDVLDSDLDNLTQYEAIEHLDLGRTNIGDAAMASVAKLSNLRYLNLRDTNVSDDGLRALEKLKRLERVYLWGSEVTPEGAKRLEKKLGEGVVIFGGSLAGPRRGGQRG